MVCFDHQSYFREGSGFLGNCNSWPLKNMPKTKQEVNHLPTIENLRRELLIPGKLWPPKVSVGAVLYFRLFWGWVFPYASRIHTAYIGEDSSILDIRIPERFGIWCMEITLGQPTTGVKRNPAMHLGCSSQPQTKKT